MQFILIEPSFARRTFSSRGGCVKRGCDPCADNFTVLYRVLCIARTSVHSGTSPPNESLPSGSVSKLPVSLTSSGSPGHLPSRPVSTLCSDDAAPHLSSSARVVRSAPVSLKWQSPAITPARKLSPAPTELTGPIVRYLELQNIIGHLKYKIIVFQGQFSILSAFSIQKFEKPLAFVLQFAVRRHELLHSDDPR